MLKLKDSVILTGVAVAALALTSWPPATAWAQDSQPAGASSGQTEEKKEPAAPAETKAAAPASHAATSSSHPPRTGKFVGDHWTPYNPPSVESFPQGSQVHVIVAGDTLWDLSGKYLQNPFLWPQIWDVNQYITDSHWIYPGDPLLIPGKPTVIGEAGPPAPAIEVLQPPVPQPPSPPGGQEPQAPPAASAQLTPAGPVLEPVADESDVYCSSYIVDAYEPTGLEIREREDGSRTILGSGDIVFLNKGLDANITAGAQYTIVSDKGVVRHPIFSENVGEGVRMIGRLKVIAVQATTSTAEIEQACDAVRIGMDLIPYEEIPIPLTTPVEFQRYGVNVDTSTAGYIVEVTPDKANIGSGDIVNIDMGAENGLQPGDVLTVFRDWAGAVEFASPESYIEGQQARAERRRSRGGNEPAEIAQTILGQAVILRTQKHTATAKVILSAREMSLGDRVASH